MSKQPPVWKLPVAPRMRRSATYTTIDVTDIPLILTKASLPRSLPSMFVVVHDNKQPGERRVSMLNLPVVPNAPWTSAIDLESITEVDQAHKNVYVVLTSTGDALI